MSKLSFLKELENVARYFYPKARDKRQAMKLLREQILKEWYETNIEQIRLAKEELEKAVPKKPTRKKIRKAKVKLETPSKKEIEKILTELLRLGDITVEKIVTHFKSKNYKVTQGKDLKPVLENMKKNKPPLVDFSGRFVGKTQIISLISGEYITEPELIEEPSIEISDKEFFNYVKLAYHTLPKMGDVIPIPELRSGISKFTHLTNERIDLYLYRLFLQHKVDLQPGKSKAGESPLRADDGSEFYWFKLR